VIEGGGISLFRFSKAISRASWIFFMNDIPTELWIDAMVILMEHGVRLDRLSGLSLALQTNEKIRRSMLSQKKSVAYLAALAGLLPKASIQNRKDIRLSLSKVLSAVRHSPYFAKEQYWGTLANERSELMAAWRRFGGPERRYSREASRYLRPLVRDLFDYLDTSLRRIVSDPSTPWINRDPRPTWVVSASRMTSGVTRSGRAIYEIIGDLARFFYDWHHFKRFDSGIEPPEWRGDGRWSSVPDEDRELLAAVGKNWRREFGNRMRMINA
jgi:hypothetical protein